MDLGIWMQNLLVIAQYLDLVSEITTNLLLNTLLVHRKNHIHQ